MLWVAIVRVVFACIFLLFSLTSCKRSVSPISSTPPSPSRALQLHKIEGCSLITREEVGAVQATTVTDTKSSETTDGNHLITQCYYATTGLNLSVSIAITQPDPANPMSRSARETWEQTFGPFDQGHAAEAKAKEEKTKENERGREEEEQKRAPTKIGGVGEEAFWVGNRFGGALYALKGDVFIRISVGGADKEETKLEKSKNLAQKALSRLP
jgi:hypothetical protein